MSVRKSGAPAIVPPPIPPLACNQFTLPRGTVLHRIHDRRFEATAFNPGIGNSRFAPFEAAGTVVPTVYAATSLECAVFESIYHDIEPTAAFKSVLWSSLVPLNHSTITVSRDLTLARLFSADLMKWKLERRQLIDTPRSTYTATRLWSPAIHQSDEHLAGMIWTSRKYDEERAMMLFGDRLRPTDLVALASIGLTTAAATLQTVLELVERAGIEIIK